MQRGIKMSSIFEMYPSIQYPIEVKGNTILKQISDITSNIRLTQKTIDYSLNYDTRVLGDGESFEITANEVYDDPENHVLVMLANDHFDWRNDIPLSSAELQSMINEKYSEPYGIHHYEDLDGNIVDNVWGDDDEPHDIMYPHQVIPITNYEYEIRLNEAKRPIKVIKQEFSSVVNRLMKDKLQENE